MQIHLQSHCKVRACYSLMQKIKWHQRSPLTGNKMLRCIPAEAWNDKKEGNRNELVSTLLHLFSTSLLSVC